MVGVPLVDVAHYVGWTSLDTADYYIQTGRVINRSRAASALAESTHSKRSHSVAVLAAETFRSKNYLRGCFFCLLAMCALSQEKGRDNSLAPLLGRL